MMNIRDRLLRKSKKSNDNSYKDLYREFRNRVSTELREGKASYFYTYFQNNSNSNFPSKTQSIFFESKYLT